MRYSRLSAELFSADRELCLHLFCLSPGGQPRSTTMPIPVISDKKSDKAACRSSYDLAHQSRGSRICSRIVADWAGYLLGHLSTFRKPPAYLSVIVAAIATVSSFCPAQAQTADGI